MAKASRKPLLLFSQRPQPPRGPTFNANGNLAWDEPQEKRPGRGDDSDDIPF